MSNRNSSTKSNSTKSNTNRKSNATVTVTPQPQQATPTRQAVRPQTMAQPTTQTAIITQTTTRRARKPITIRVRATGEEIRRVPVERSGYRVVRYEGRYHTVRGGGRTAPYIVGSEDSEDMLGRA
jgi:hypothetical protein